MSSLGKKKQKNDVVCGWEAPRRPPALGSCLGSLDDHPNLALRSNIQNTFSYSANDKMSKIRMDLNIFVL